ncbi:hypothetical protein F503_01524 [Ophiostoma piceae UAMH 11346]|uniref:Uncharacterized protein n=1 Tax=Ophiostoma piceae (strain UAMH 11346) TaxID=1262450 RepID=S3CAE9_OPHP1|nr:hypothetical protein F503_01524 [Ophiostoma piceae UAMH 11346]
MAVVQGISRDYRLGSRVPLVIRNIASEATRIARDAPSKVIERASSTTTACEKEDSNLCEKPEGGGSMTLPIVLGVVIPLVVISVVLFYLHRRNVKQVAQEDSMDAHKSLDFGLALDPTKQSATKAKRKSSFFGGEKDMFSNKQRQLSMDMNLSSPYLLPPELQNSRESLNSLARTLHQNEDPYRPVHSQYGGSDAASMRSFRKDTASTYTRGSGIDPINTRGTSRNNRLSVGPNSPHSPRSRSPLPPPYPAENLNGLGSMPTSPAAVKQSPFTRDPNAPVEVGGDEKPRIHSPVEADSHAVDAVAELQAPEPTASKIGRKGVPVSSVEEPAELPNHRATTGTVDEPFIYDSPNKGYRHDSSTYAGFDLNLDTAQNEPLSSSLPKLTLGGPFDDETFLPGQATSSNGPTLPHVVLPEDQNSHQYGNELYPEDPADEDRGRGMHRRQSSEYPQDNNAAGARQSALGLPQADSRRLSVGVRPLPPDELIESEDPETRANRIRSFYKEYFDDSKPDMAEYNQHYPPQGVPNEWRGNGAGGAGGAQYYEDYDASYQNGEANAYFDPQSNTFVMPYAQPVQRRAMTPPPSGSRFPGGGRPRGPNGPRNVHGSMGGPMGPRAGSAMSQGMRPDSSASNRYPGSRSASNMSGRIGAPKKALPPPEILNTLPTPSKLKDDSFALLNAIDFAPPPNLKDQAAGRSQSPLGERRPYQMMPAGSPLVSAFEEMAALPSPHLLRKSSTFTGLDFAPPRKFKDADTMSDAGSIRSNRSGISAVNQAAIRSGAGRVSRLPGDQVFTSAALADTLKPNWGMRP